MQTMAQKTEEGDGGSARRTLESLRADRNRGWEWNFWKGEIDGKSTTLDWRGLDSPQIAADSRRAWLAVADSSSLTIYDVQGRRHARIDLPRVSGETYLLESF